MMNKEEIKVLFPDDIEAITISKNDYDRLFGELTYENIELKQRIDNIQKTKMECLRILLDVEYAKKVDKVGE